MSNINSRSPEGSSVESELAGILSGDRGMSLKRNLARVLWHFERVKANIRIGRDDSLDQKNDTRLSMERIMQARMQKESLFELGERYELGGQMNFILQSPVTDELRLDKHLTVSPFKFDARLMKVSVLPMPTVESYDILPQGRIAYGEFTADPYGIGFMFDQVAVIAKNADDDTLNIVEKLNTQYNIVPLGYPGLEIHQSIPSEAVKELFDGTNRNNWRP